MNPFFALVISVTYSHMVYTLYSHQLNINYCDEEHPEQSHTQTQYREKKSYVFNFEAHTANIHLPTIEEG